MNVVLANLMMSDVCLLLDVFSINTIIHTCTYVCTYVRTYVYMYLKIKVIVFQYYDSYTLGNSSHLDQRQLGQVPIH